MTAATVHPVGVGRFGLSPSPHRQDADATTQSTPDDDFRRRAGVIRPLVKNADPGTGLNAVRFDLFAFAVDELDLFTQGKTNRIGRLSFHSDRLAGNVRHQARSCSWRVGLGRGRRNQRSRRSSGLRKAQHRSTDEQSQGKEGPVHWPDYRLFPLSEQG